MKIFRVFLISLMLFGVIAVPGLAESPIPTPEQVEELTVVPPSFQHYREIMGENFFGIEEAISHFGVEPTVSDFEALVDVPFSEQTLQECKDTHILIAVFPMSILDIRNVDNSFFYSPTGGWYEDEEFASNKAKTGWYLVKKTTVKNSNFRTWKDQQALLADNEVTPTARVLVYTIIGHYKNTGERLFEKIYARCSDLDSGGNRVDVGLFGSVGLCIFDSRDTYRFNIDVSSSRKPD